MEGSAFPMMVIAPNSVLFHRGTAFEIKLAKVVSCSRLQHIAISLFSFSSHKIFPFLALPKSKDTHTHTHTHTSTHSRKGRKEELEEEEIDRDMVV